MNNFYKIKKKTVLKVTIFHFILISLLFFQNITLKKNKKNNLIVNNIIEIPPQKIVTKQLPTPKPEIKNKPVPTKKNEKQIPKAPTPIQKTPTSKKTQPSKTNNFENLMNKLEKQINEIDNSQRKPTTQQNLSVPTTVNISKSEKELIVPKNIHPLNIDNKIQEIEDQTPLEMKKILIKELQENLNLPEYGEVKVSFTILPEGEIIDITVLEHQSEANQKYLKNRLSELSFKSINKMFSEPQQFIVIFKNE